MHQQPNKEHELHRLRCYDPGGCWSLDATAAREENEDA